VAVIACPPILRVAGDGSLNRLFHEQARRYGHGRCEPYG